MKARPNKKFAFGYQAISSTTKDKTSFCPEFKTKTGITIGSGSVQKASVGINVYYDNTTGYKRRTVFWYKIDFAIEGNEHSCSIGTGTTESRNTGLQTYHRRNHMLIRKTVKYRFAQQFNTEIAF